MSWASLYVRDAVTGAIHRGVDESMDVAGKTIRTKCAERISFDALSAGSWKETRRWFKLGPGGRCCAACEPSGGVP